MPLIGQVNFTPWPMDISPNRCVMTLALLLHLTFTPACFIHVLYMRVDTWSAAVRWLANSAWHSTNIMISTPASLEVQEVSTVTYRTRVTPRDSWPNVYMCLYDTGTDTVFITVFIILLYPLPPHELYNAYRCKGGNWSVAVIYQCLIMINNINNDSS